MANKERENERYDALINTLCDKHPEMPFLIGFKDWSLNDQSFRTVYYYCNHIVNFLEYANKEIKDLTLDDYTSYSSKMKRKKISSSLQAGRYAALKRFSEYLIITDRIEKNFMTGAKRPKTKETQEQKEKRNLKVLTPAEIRKILTNIKHGITNNRYLWTQERFRARDMAIVMLFLSTGIRGSALVNTDVNDIDFKEKTITVTDKGDKVNIHNIPDDTITILKKWLLMREAMLKERDKTEETALFISARRQRICYTAMQDIVCKYCSDVTGRKITPHALRATYGTILYNKTHDLEFVRDQMNHSSITTTQRYIRGNGKRNREKAASIIGDVISKKNEEKNEDMFEWNNEYEERFNEQFGINEDTEENKNDGEEIDTTGIIDLSTY